MAIFSSRRYKESKASCCKSLPSHADKSRSISAQDIGFGACIMATGCRISMASEGVIKLNFDDENTCWGKAFKKLKIPVSFHWCSPKERNRNLQFLKSFAP